MKTNKAAMTGRTEPAVKAVKRSTENAAVRGISAEELLRATERRLASGSRTTLEAALPWQLHNALSGAAMDALAPFWQASEAARSAKKQACYLSAEYLVGRLVYNNLFCMGVLDEVKARFAERGIDLAVLEDIEDDAFGNGGLGRLAACYLDSAATQDIPLTGYGLRYRYGLFRQSIEGGRQHEEPDDWSRFGDPWSVRRLDLAVTVRMKTGDVLAVPYDMPVIGYGTKNVGTLRLWQCESLHPTDFPLFNDQQYARAAADRSRAEGITAYLYPNDTKRAGRLLRVKQQYVLVSASVQDMLRSFETAHGTDWARLPGCYAVQLNDTHPVMAIPELIRLLNERGVGFDEAFAIAREIFAYTNHTVMQEALEKWDLPLLQSVSPELVRIMRRIDARFRAETKLPVTPTHCIIEGGRVHMAQLAVYAAHAVNGVALIHSRILRDTLFSDWYAEYPERFRNVTNGVTQRRWLGLCSPELTALLEKEIGGGFLTDLRRLESLRPVIGGPEGDRLADAFNAVKQEKKRQLAEAVAKETGVVLDPEMIFDVQVKRLHEYKRQLMNALCVLMIYERLKAGRLKDFTPTAVIFGAKAAPGYARAKSIIRLICLIADRVNADPETNSRLKVVFIPEYNCSWAEKIMPAADISEQISPAGTEASGTGNMKLMLNGAVTLGTFDGANVEIVEQAGRENNYIFGGTVDELNALKDSWDPRTVYKKDKELRRAVDALDDGTFPADDGLRELKRALLDGASWHKPDHYFLLHDLPGYLEARLQANRDYRDRRAFAKKCLYNIAGAGKFSSDRSVAEYAKEIWHV